MYHAAAVGGQSGILLKSLESVIKRKKPAEKDLAYAHCKLFLHNNGRGINSRIKLTIFTIGLAFTIDACFCLVSYIPVKTTDNHLWCLSPA